MTDRPVVLAGGGTGGHVFPAIAVARELRALGVDAHFLGAERGMEGKAVPAAGFELSVLPIEPMKGGGVKRAVRGGAIAAAGVFKAMAKLRALRPRAVLGVGGYAAGPSCLAAVLLGVPMAILEPNAVPGFTNRLLLPVAKRVYVPWAEIAASAGARQRVLGVPLRGGFEPQPYDAAAPAKVVVLGGSQGARALNHGVPRALGELVAAGVELRVLHQTGAKDVEQVRALYMENAVPAEVTPFLQDVPAELAAASLVVARSGASTVAELLAVGRPMLLVPFAAAADDHQSGNAARAVKAGAARLVREAELEASLARELGQLLAQPSRRAQMAQAAQAIGRPHAARAVAEDLLELARA